MKQKTAWRLMGILCLLMVACGPAIAPEGSEAVEVETADFVPYTSADAAVSFRYPEAWVLEEGSGGVTIVTAESYLQPQSFAGGGGMNINTTSVAELGTMSLPDLMTPALALFTEQQNGVIIEGPTEGTLGGYESITAVLSATDSADTPVTLQYTILLGDVYAAFIVGAVDAEMEDELMPQINAVIRSIDLATQ